MKRERILVADDNERVAEALVESLLCSGYQVVGIAHSGEEALNLAAQTRLDLALINISLSGNIDAIETATQISHRFNIPVVYLAIDANDELLERTKFSACGYVFNPFKDKELHATIELALHQYFAKARTSPTLRQKYFHINPWLGQRLQNLLSIVSQLLLSRQSRWLGKCREQELSSAQTAVEYLSNSIDSVLILEEIEDSYCATPELFDLKQLCQQLIDDLHAKNIQQKIEVFAAGGVFNPQQPCRQVYLDKYLVRIIVTHLLTNASRFSRRSTTIYLDLSWEHDEVILRVHDRGIGIPVADRQCLFEPYCQGSNTEKIGLGIGLTIVKKCVDLHGGMMTIESAEGAGTTITVRLPAVTLA